MEALILIAVFWIAPIFVGHAIGKPKGRTGWAWGLLLGWLGVIIVALLSPVRDVAREVRESADVSRVPILQREEVFASCPACAAHEFRMIEKTAETYT